MTDAVDVGEVGLTLGVCDGEDGDLSKFFG